jgi:hypothetical protein
MIVVASLASLTKIDRGSTSQSSTLGVIVVMILTVAGRADGSSSLKDLDATSLSLAFGSVLKTHVVC